MKYLIGTITVLLIFSCEKKEPNSEDEIYTLYRGGVIKTELRIHYATFETKGEKPDWNKSNCEEISEHLNSVQKLRFNPVKFWCEKGEYHE